MTRIRLLVLGLLLTVIGVSACAPQHTGNEVIVWTANAGNEQVASLQKIGDLYTQRTGVPIRVVRAPSVGDGDATQLITAVRGNTAPDVYLGDRFGTAQFAALGLVDSIQNLVDTEPGLTDNYVPFAVNEATYNGALYGLPFDTDTRGLYYNKKLVREAGFDPEVLDPKNGAPTMEQVWEIADKITKTNARGGYDRLGFYPWDQQGWPFTWGLKNGAILYDQNSCSIAVDDPGFRRIYTEHAEWAAKLDYGRVSAFKAAYQPANAPPSQNAFFLDRQGMTVLFSNFTYNIKKYAPDLDWGVTYLPVDKKGDRPYSWSGGFAMMIPKGATNRDGAWDFMKFATGPVGQKTWSVEQQYLPTWKALLDDKEAVGENAFFADLLKDGYSTSRPALPIGAELWSTMNTARDAVLLGDSTPDQAMTEIQRRLQPQLDPYCPVTLADNG